MSLTHLIWLYLRLNWTRGWPKGVFWSPDIPAKRPKGNADQSGAPKNDVGGPKQYIIKYSPLPLISKVAEGGLKE